MSIVRKLRQIFYRRLLRRRIISRVHGDEVRVNGWSRVQAKVDVGRNANFNGIRTFGHGVIVIGDNFHSAAGLRVLTQSHNYMGSAIPYDRTVVTKNVSIGDNVWIGLDVLILPGVSIGEGAIIQAGSVVAIDVPPLAIAGGNPARPIKFRDAEHYWRLKSDGKFH